MRDSTRRSSSRFRARRLCEASSTSNCGRSYSANEMSRYIRMFSWESAHSEACCTHRRQLDHGRDGPTELRNAISFLREHSIAGGYRDEPDVRLDPQTEVDISFKLLVVILFGILSAPREDPRQFYWATKGSIFEMIVRPRGIMGFLKSCWLGAWPRTRLLGGNVSADTTRTWPFMP
jgi:hypothetical protein